MRDGIGKPVFHTALRARGCDLDPVCELPYRPAATERPQQRPYRCQHLTTRDTIPKILLAFMEASTDARYNLLGRVAGDRMKRFVAGADRGQSTLFPECLDDWVDETNPVRVIDAFVDTLDLGGLDFEGVVP